MGLCQGEEELSMMCLFRGDLLKDSEPKIKSCFIFFDLEKAFNWVSREVICFTLKQKSVPEYLVNGFMSLYKGCGTAVSVDGALSSSFSVKASVH